MVLNDWSVAEKIEKFGEICMELEDPNEIFKLITEESIVGIGIFQNNKFEYINRKFIDITGYSLKEWNEFSPEDYFKVIHPEDLELVIEQAERKQKGEKNILNHYIYRGIKKSGEIIWSPC